MKVTILSHTPEPEKVVASAARLCYSKTSAQTLMDDFSEEKAASFIQKLMDMGHMSPAEHVSFTFAIDGVSRTLLAQITRHRIASFSVQSLRYNNPFDDELEKDSKDMLSTENMCYLEGLVYSKNFSKQPESFFQEHLDKFNIRGKLPDDIPNVHMSSYIRGIFDGTGCFHEGPKPTISFPIELKSVITDAIFNITLQDDKLLIKNDNALKFALYIYDDLDFIKSLYIDKKLLSLVNSSRELKDNLAAKAIEYIDINYYSTIPNSVLKNPEAILEYIKGLDECKKSYIELVKMGIDQEDARNILPMGTQTRMVMTMNVRSLYNFFSLRCCARAQSEIRELANLMLTEVKKVAPGLFQKAGAPCEAEGICPEGSLSCGRYPTKK